MSAYGKVDKESYKKGFEKGVRAALESDELKREFFDLHNDTIIPWYLEERDYYPEAKKALEEYDETDDPGDLWKTFCDVYVAELWKELKHYE